MSTAESPNLEGDDPPEPLVHADERQVHLDADRSFVIYPEREPRRRPSVYRNCSNCVVSSE